MRHRCRLSGEPNVGGEPRELHAEEQGLVKRNVFGAVKAGHTRRATWWRTDLFWAILHLPAQPKVLELLYRLQKCTFFKNT